MSSSSSNTRASNSFLFDANASEETFYVFCVYNFETAHASQLSFRRNEILEIVKKAQSVSKLYGPGPCVGQFKLNFDVA